MALSGSAVVAPVSSVWFADTPGRDLRCGEPGCEWWLVTVYTEAQQHEVMEDHRRYHSGRLNAL